jgi:hypothetical protein
MKLRGGAARVSKVIRHVFGLAELRPGQQAVIDAVIVKHHTLDMISDRPISTRSRDYAHSDRPRFWRSRQPRRPMWLPTSNGNPRRDVERDHDGHRKE